MHGACVFPRFQDGVKLSSRRPGHLVFSFRDRGQFEVNTRSEEVAQAVVNLVEGGRPEEILADFASLSGIKSDVTTFYYLLERFYRANLLVHEWHLEGKCHAVLEATEGTALRGDVSPVRSDARLSRYSYLRRLDKRLSLEKAGNNCQLIILSEACLVWVGSLAGVPCNSPEVPQSFLELLGSSGFLVDPESHETEDEATWEFHDRLFHCRSRMGLGASQLGASYRFRNILPPGPAIKAPMSDIMIPLERPDLVRRDLAVTESLDSVFERRRSIRMMNNERPITKCQVGDLLYRVARVRDVRSNGIQEIVSRPVPSAGAIHEIELYLLSRSCEGLDPGLYHYHAQHHCFYKLDSRDESLKELMESAAKAMDESTSLPQCLLILASRLPRLAWKYEGIAYRLSLLNAGVLIHALYLVATEMNLACTAIGTGNSGAFAKATGTDSFVETSIAEFVIGSVR
jgi:oxazoline/thiazoline dehydrogenase